MFNRENDLNDQPWLRTDDIGRQAIIALADDIHTLKNRGCAVEALHAEHKAIEVILQGLWQAVLSGTGRVEVIEILNAAVDFSATHFAEEEEFMRTAGKAQWEVHAAAHKTLLAKMVAARQAALGEGLSLAVLDTTDLLHDFHEHVGTYDRCYAENQRFA